jgi:hypothetical protein
VASEGTLFPFSLSLLHQISQLVRQDMWKMRQEMPENGRISGASQVYLLLREKEIPAFSTAQGKMIMRMTPEAFHTWSQLLRLSSETEALIASIRSSPPVRQVSGRAKNITGRYPSPKMGVSIQFESEHVEFWAIFTE